MNNPGYIGPKDTVVAVALPKASSFHCATVDSLPGHRLLLSGNEAAARAAWEAGVAVATSYPGTPATEILENLALFPDLHVEWSVNEKVALEVAIGASLAGSRALCTMKHVGLNVASDALMTQTLAGVAGGLVLIVADDVGLSSSQNEQDSRYWGRFAHLPVLEPSDSQEVLNMVKAAFTLSERLETLVLVRMTTRTCHVKTGVTVGARENHVALGFKKDPTRWVMTPAHAGPRIIQSLARDRQLAAESDCSPFNVLEDGVNPHLGIVTSGVAHMHVKEAFPDAPVLKLGFSHPLPVAMVRALAARVERLLVVEETEPLVEMEIKALGLAIPVHGKDVLPRSGELTPQLLQAGLSLITSTTQGIQDPRLSYAGAIIKKEVFNRPPTMCPACPHLGVFYTLSRIRNIHIVGDIGCYTLGAGHPWEALDVTICMGASMGIALGLDKGRGQAEAEQRIVAVIGDSTFLHMGMQGLLNITYNQGNVTVLLLDNRAVGMTGGQDGASTGRDIRGKPTKQVDFPQLVAALGVAPERIHMVDPYQLPVLFKTLHQELAMAGPSVIITNRPCVLIDHYQPMAPLTVDAAKCNGCANCLNLGCPAILVAGREKLVKPNGQEVEQVFVSIENTACTGCNLCLGTCARGAFVPLAAMGQEN